MQQIGSGYKRPYIDGCVVLVHGLHSGVRKSSSYREWEVGNRKQVTALIDFQTATLEL